METGLIAPEIHRAAQLTCVELHRCESPGHFPTPPPGDWPLPFPGGDPGHLLWGTGPLGRNTEAQVLRGLVKHAELAETDADRLAVIRAGIQVLQGHAAVLELAVGEDV
jgi:hypothetical protein